MQHALATSLAGLAAADGFLACALVDVDTGMVVHVAGDAAQAQVAEAATDYWRLCRRQAPTLGGLGSPRAQVLIHQHARLTLVECGAGLLLVSVTAEPDRVDWARWKRGVGLLARASAGI